MARYSNCRESQIARPERIRCTFPETSSFSSAANRRNNETLEEFVVPPVACFCMIACHSQDREEL